ncbi:MAG: Uma2 family endonuclease [Chloroflexota bacterium]|nr:Uma2 family endonuclease [Chloroflexota bacterium]
MAISPEQLQASCYLTNGSQLVWLVDPKYKQVTVFSAKRPPVVLLEDDTLDGGTLLPGFTLAVAEIFVDA